MGTNSVLGIIVVVALCAIMLAIGAIVSKKNATTEDYYIGGGKVSTFVIICTQCATFVGGGMTLGWIGMGANRGLGGVWYMWPQALGFVFAALFMTKLLRKEGKHFISVPDWLDDMYHNKTLRVVAAILTMVVPITWVCGQSTAAARMLEGLGIPYLVALFVVGGVVILYSTFGGFLAVVYTDTLQWIILFVLYIVCVPWALIKAGGFGAALAAMPVEMQDFMHVPGMPRATWFFWTINGIVGSMGLQTTFQRIYAAKSTKAANIGLYATAVATVIFSFLATFTGMAIVKLGLPAETVNDSVWPWFLNNYMPLWVGVVYTVVIMMATMSSADSMLNSISLSASHDIYKNVINPKADDKKVLKVGIIVSGIFGIISLYWASFGGWMLKAFGYGWTIGAGPMSAILILAAIFKGKANQAGMIIGMIAGAIAGVLSSFIPALKDVPAGGTIISFGVALVIPLIMTLAAPGKEKAAA